jgi:hypothetical protein
MAQTSRATVGRAEWTRELFEIAHTRGMPRLAALIIRNECDRLGRGKGWRWACEWFHANDRQAGRENWDTDGWAWFVIQSLIWFGREV